MMRTMMKITAVAAIALAGEAQATDIRQWTPASTGDPIDWDGTLQYWTKCAQQTGDIYALRAYGGKFLGVWGSSAHFKAIESVGITREYLEQQTVIEACLTNINDKLCPADDYNETKGPPSEEELTGIYPADTPFPVRPIRVPAQSR